MYFHAVKVYIVPEQRFLAGSDADFLSKWCNDMAMFEETKLKTDYLEETTL